MTYPKVSAHQPARRSPRRALVPRASRRSRSASSSTGTRTAPSGLGRAPVAGKNGDNEFVFYDGPPFANGLPHYGHLLTGYVKDLIPRYQTMRGRRVERRFGWDTHGLPAELEAMSQLGIKTKDEILEIGIEKFNDKCRYSVLKYTDEWRDYVTRQARWVDFDNDYKTLNPDYMESVIWAFKSLYDKGLVYEGFRVLPYCWNDQTPLSNHELRMDDDVYQMRQDPAVTVGVRLSTGELALDLDDDAVDPAVQPRDHGRPRHRLRRRGVVDFTGTTERYVIGEARLAAYAATCSRRRGDVEAVVVERLKGRDLLGRTYTPPFCYYAGHENAHRVVAPPTSSRPPTAPGWCTAPAPSVRTTRSSPTARASSRSCRSAPTAASPSRWPSTRACSSSTPTCRSSTTSRPRPAVEASTAR